MRTSMVASLRRLVLAYLKCSLCGPDTHMCADMLLQAVQLLVFLHSVAEKLAVQPPLKLVPSDKLRLQQCSLHLRVRQAVCKAAIQDAGASDLD